MNTQSIRWQYITERQIYILYRYVSILYPCGFSTFLVVYSSIQPFHRLSFYEIFAFFDICNLLKCLAEMHLVFFFLDSVLYIQPSILARPLVVLACT